MKKIFLFAAAALWAVNLFAVPAPTNVHWEGTTLKWELPPLTGDSVYVGLSINLYTEAGVSVTGMGGNIKTEYDYSSNIYHGRTYYAILHTRADASIEATNPVESPDVQSPNYTDPNPKDTLEVPNVTLTVDGTVSWGSIGYMFVRATLQKQNGSKWDDITSQKTSLGWSTYISLGAITTPGTYRAIAEGLQGDEVVRRGISENLVVEQMLTVTFNAQNLFANPTDAMVAKNALISAPTLPDEFKHQHDGHVFYWSTDAAGTQPWTFASDQVTQDTTLYAQWLHLPALNPVWDEDTCKWTVAENLYPVFYKYAVNIITESHKDVIGLGGGMAKPKWHGGYYCFPGHKYAFDVTMTDFFDNYVTDTSALRTFPGEAAILPLENMTVTNTSNARVEWSAPRHATYIRHAELYQWNKTTSDWDELIKHVDSNRQWDANYIVFNQALDEAEYYKIHCTLNHAEYVLYEGELFYGSKPTGIESQEPKAKSQKLLINGHLFILRGEHIYNAQGQELK